MSQQQMEQKADHAKQQSQAFGKIVYSSSVEVFDAVTSVLYYIVGAGYGAFAALLGLFQDPKVQREAKQIASDAKDGLTDGAYDIKARVSKSTGPAVNNAKAKASDVYSQAQSTGNDLSKQAQGTGNDLSKQAQGTANDFSKQANGNDFARQAQGTAKQAQGTASDLAKQGQDKATDLKNKAVSQGKQAQGQVKQTAQSNGYKN